jgi:outer membrane protein TolC
MKKTFFLLLTVFLPLLSWGQDSLKTLTLPQLFLLTVKNHPVAKQAELLSDQARAEVRFARGGFDPKLVADFARKEFKGTDYYSDFYGYLSVPTWVGVDFKAGWERSAGKYISPEGSTPINGLSFIGATAAIGNGMFIDQRRASLRQAQYLRNINEAERVKAINKLLLNAAKDYMDWYFHYQEYQYAKTGLDFADLRFRGTRERVLIGEQAGIDSVEAKILLQDRMIALQQAEVNYRNARLGLSVYLWDDNGNPLEISEKLIPELPVSASEPAFGQLLSFAENNHPEIQKLVYKGFQLEIDRRLAVEGFKPRLDVSYNFIDNTPIKAENLNGNFGRNNYKLGVDFSMPLLYRKERGKLALTKIKIEQNELERLNANREIVNNLKATFNSLLTNRSLLNMQAEMVRNYQTLRNAEIDKFDIGESSLFLVNTRESKLLEGQVKQADLERKYHKAIIELQWAAGVSDWWGR